MPLSFDNFRYAKPGPYETKLDPLSEMKFRVWTDRNKIPFDYTQTTPQDYDMRGFWKDNPNYIHQDGMHFPDTYKTPYHESFSNESKYALPTAPTWQGNDLIDQISGRKVFQGGN